MYRPVHAYIDMLFDIHVFILTYHIQKNKAHTCLRKKTWYIYSRLFMCIYIYAIFVFPYK